MRSPWTLHEIAPALLVERNDLTVVLRGAPFGQLVENVRSAQTRWTWTVPWVAHTSGLRRCQHLRPLFPALVARTTRRERPVSLGITPTTVHREQRPRETFHVYDNSLVSVELVPARVRITQPSEIALHARAFECLRQTVQSSSAGPDREGHGLSRLPKHDEKPHKMGKRLRPARPASTPIPLALKLDPTRSRHP
ncbi:hypothetical protein ASD97_11475 [Streptomyces sp. Root63]|nr:hypothetical protein ASD29_16655 [Streptomyces sp. Root1295]KRA40414.1 hypothetical protein ASD97_11475 [Streptomyces sp. Root63]